MFLSSKEEVETDKPLYHSPEKKGELLTIVGDLEIGEPCIFVNGMYLYVFYCLCYESYVYTDMLEDQVLEESDPYLNEEGGIIMDAIREEHWRYVAEEGGDKENMHALRWYI